MDVFENSDVLVPASSDDDDSFHSAGEAEMNESNDSMGRIDDSIEEIPETPDMDRSLAVDTTSYREPAKSSGSEDEDSAEDGSEAETDSDVGEGETGNADLHSNSTLQIESQSNAIQSPLEVPASTTKDVDATQKVTRKVKAIALADTSAFESSSSVSEPSSARNPPSSETSNFTNELRQKLEDLPKDKNGNPKGRTATPEFSDPEDMILHGIDSIAKNAQNKFVFKKPERVDSGAEQGASSSSHNSSNSNNSGGGHRDAFEDDIDDFAEDDIDANFDFEQDDTAEIVDIGSSSSAQSASPPINHLESDDDDVNVVFQGSSNAVRKPKRNVIMDDEDDEDSADDIQVLTKGLNSIPLGQKTAHVRQQPSKAIFLNTPPPPPAQSLGFKPYKPKALEDQEFYGDVRRTVSKLAETITEMPTPDNYEPLDRKDLPRGMVELFEYQQYGLQWLRWRESEFPGGGILADEMGLGKTIMMIALMGASKMQGSADNSENWVSPSDISRLVPSKTTLVVCPVGCLMQWESEIKSKSGGLSVTTYHGPNRTKSAAHLAQFDVIITTYSTISAEMPKDQLRSNSPLARLCWKRIILDEAHTIRNPKTVAALAICKLTARHRWAVTGTPVHNRPADFQSLIKFLRMTPFDDPKVWDFWIGMKQLRPNLETKQRLEILGKALILRRTKEEVKNSGRTIPPKVEEIVRVELSESERKLYDHLKTFCKQQFQDFLLLKSQKEAQLKAAAYSYDAKSKNKQKNEGEGGGFAILFAMIMRLRQCSVLPILIKSMIDDEEDIDEDVSFDENEDIVSMRNPILQDDYQSSKLQAVLKDLIELRDVADAEKREMDKVVIVSSWVTLLERLHSHLRSLQFRCVFITGKQNIAERSDSMRAFNNSASRVKICLVSLTAGGVGINLTGGNRVFFLEPHWNPQLEKQAQDRVHRIGQKKDVVIKRYISVGTIEDRICELQEQKLDLADGVLNSAKRTGTGSGLSLAQMKHLFEV